MDFYFLINCSTSLYNRPKFFCNIFVVFYKIGLPPWVIFCWDINLFQLWRFLHSYIKGF